MIISLANFYGVSKGLLNGLNKYPQLPVTHVSLGTLTAARLAARDGLAAHIAAQQETRLAVRNRALARQENIAYAAVCSDVLVPYLGRVWSSTTWPKAGWRKGSIATPTALPDLINLFSDLHPFLEDHEDYEAPKANVTALIVKQHLDKLEACAQCVLDARSEQRKKRELRKKSDEVLLGQTRDLAAELEIILKPGDVRWMDFVASVPGDEKRPDSVEVVVAKGTLAGQLEVDWERPLRAVRYYVEVLVPGPDAKFKRLATVKDTNASLTGLPPGVQVKVRVIAVNEAGEALPSEEVTVEVPALPKAA